MFIHTARNGLTSARFSSIAACAGKLHHSANSDEARPYRRSCNLLLPVVTKQSHRFHQSLIDQSRPLFCNYALYILNTCIAGLRVSSRHARFMPFSEKISGQSCGAALVKLRFEQPFYFLTLARPSSAIYWRFSAGKMMLALGITSFRGIHFIRLYFIRGNLFQKLNRETF